MTKPLLNDLLKVGAIAAGLLLIPLLGMVFTDQVVWGPEDFLIAWLLLAGAGSAYKLISGRIDHSSSYKFAVGIAVLTALLLIWVNLAVGLIGSEDNPANLLYAGVLAVGVLGAAFARLRPRGLSRTFWITAIAQALVPIIALIIWKPPMTTAEQTSGVLAVIFLNTIFVALWCGSAWLFRKTSRQATISTS